MIAMAWLVVKPEASVPRLPSSSALPVESQRTAREPLSVPLAYFSAMPTPIPLSFAGTPLAPKKPAELYPLPLAAS